MLSEERKIIVEYGKKMVRSGLTAGTGGNLSIFDRNKGYIAVSPSGMDYFETNEDDVVLLRQDGSIVEGERKPTSEKDLHLAIYHARPDVNAVVHVHSVFATTLATLGWEIPPISYLVAMSGSKVPIAPYRTFGTPELAKTVSRSLEGYNAVLMENHGLVTVGRDMRSAFTRAETMEFVAQIYWRARSLGEPGVLSDEEIHNVMEKFRTYGQ